MDTEAVEVIVTEGRVLLNPSMRRRESLIDETEPLVSQLSAGQRSVVDLDADLVAPIVEEIAIAEIETRLAWRDEKLDFTEMALSEVALEFNRRNHTQLVIGDLELNDLPVSGAFSSNNLDLFVEALGLYGVNVEYDGTSKIVLRKCAIILFHTHSNTDLCSSKLISETSLVKNETQVSMRASNRSDAHIQTTSAIF